MKSTNWITLAALLGTCSFAAAQDEKPARQQRELPEAIVKKYDKDGDGKLSDEERKGMRDEMQAERKKRQEEVLKKFDKDGDGTLNDEEKAAAAADAEAKRKEFLEKYDTDKDGKMSREEMQAARAAGAEIPMMGRGGFGGPGGPGGRRGGGDGEPKGEKPAPAPEAKPEGGQ